ncbi:MAG: hypothetical protein H6956_07350 [Chromatiaceae bacterium]|nr:hypothetical protein [Gammaproteobacteria bacterium]MCP5317720.1 hypothetical protein [Chromatiaceae bacterium]MCP5429264.1 hypothetical protein [Chromatiaceae bacterium]MCP5434808.1 hypothetical protein [Chromatiaceae bacterium]HOP15880.1 hypothetical protein [Gammaproteobacteria bacterium]
MKTQANITGISASQIKNTYRGLVAGAALGAGLAQNVDADSSDYYRDALLNPSKAVLLTEHSGRVTIFDGLDDHLVDQALDQQYERIGRMMFVRTRHVRQDGSVESDDDCD